MRVSEQDNNGNTMCILTTITVNIIRTTCSDFISSHYLRPNT